MKTVNNIGHQSTSYVVETAEIAALIEPYIAQQASSYEETGYGRQQRMGPLVALAEGWSHIDGRTKEAAFRRLYSVRSGETLSMNVESAEKLLFAMDDNISMHDIPIFPAGKNKAKEMVDIWAEDWSPLERKQLTASLWNFTKGFFSVDKIESSDVFALLSITCMEAAA